MRTIMALVFLAGCSAPPPVTCPGPVPAPAGIPAKHTALQVADLEIRVELARERERARGDACAAAVETLQQWIEDHE